MKLGLQVAIVLKGDSIPKLSGDNLSELAECIREATYDYLLAKGDEDTDADVHITANGPQSA